MMKYIIGIVLAVAVIGVVWYGTRHAAAPVAVQETTTVELPALTEPTEVSRTEASSAPITKPNTFKIQNMQITITKEGTGPSIVNGQTAVMSYTGRLENGTVFDSNVDPKFMHVEPFEFPLGAGMVIKGWDEGVLGMKVGESRTLVIPADMAYGSRGAGAAIPPNATLTFDVTLNGIK